MSHRRIEVRSSRSLEGLLIAAVVIALALSVGGIAAYKVYASFTATVAQFEAATKGAR